ncbi:MAG: DUF3343 domain-containing protein [Chitinivibrionales bacterium]|nr:DUF3343 domain-containing protein [Chitinivibrionales bacterium]
MTVLLLFQSVHKVIAAEKIILSQSIPYQIVPIPKHISSECGIAIQIEKSALETVKTALAAQRVSILSIADHPAE